MGKTALLDYASRVCRRVQGHPLRRRRIGAGTSVRCPPSTVHAAARRSRDAAGAPARRATNGFRSEVGSAPRSFSRRSRGADPALERGRAAAADLRRRRRAMARPLLRPKSCRSWHRRLQAESGLMALFAERDQDQPNRSSAGCRNLCCSDYRTLTHAICSPHRLRDGSTNGSVSGSSTRHAGTRSRCSSCLAASRRRVWPAALRWRIRCRLSAAWRRAFGVRSTGYPRRAQRLLLLGAAEPTGDQCSFGKRCGAWSSDRGGCSCRSGRPHRCRYASYLPPSIASVGDLPCCIRR